MRSAFVYLFICLFAYLLTAPSTWAAGEFVSGYDVSYTIAPSGKTIVTQRITLTNKLSNYYPERFALTLDSDKISSVLAYDEGGLINPVITVRDGKTDISLTFNQPVVGLGKQLNFTIRYEHGDIAHKVGSIWEVYVPGIVDDPDIGSYNVSLQVPASFGQNAYLVPAPESGRVWTKKQMAKGGIAGAWGSQQNYIFNLSYYLTNPRLTPLTSKIALPPDTAFQKVVIQSLEPQPTTVQQDADGNWLAAYQLGPGQNLTIKAEVGVVVFLEPRVDFPAIVKDSALYLQSDEYWEVGNPQIQQLSETYRTPRQIYDHVVRTLSYDYARINENPTRQGALQALVSPSKSVCMEFTDLFIAMARAAGIPARENVGYAHTTNTKLRPLSLVADVLHAWPEYYDQERRLWIPVDPTWADTTGGVNYFDKLDFDHIVFAIHGLSSSQPIPAGFYKEAGRLGKDINVSFAEKQIILPQPQFETNLQFAKVVVSGTNPKGLLIVKNQTGALAYKIPVTIEADEFGLKAEYVKEVLLPYERFEVPFSLSIPVGFEKKQAVIITAVNGKLREQVFDIQPSYYLLALVTILTSATLFLGILLVRLIWRKWRKK